jgi:hypothetical protein
VVVSVKKTEIIRDQEFALLGLWKKRPMLERISTRIWLRTLQDDSLGALFSLRLFELIIN